MFRLILIFLLNLCTPTFTLQAADDVSTLLNQASHHLNNDLNKAETVIEKALRLTPNNPEVNFLCGRIMGRKADTAFFTALSYANKSLSCLKKAVDLKPEQVRYRMGLLNFYLGAPAIAGGDIQLALQEINTISQLDPIQGAKAEITYYRKTEQKQLLKEKLIKWIKKYPENNEFYFRLGLMLQDEKEYTRAFDAFKKAANYQDEQIYYLNSLYQIGRNAVFSHLFIQQGIDALTVFIAQSRGQEDVPSHEWAALRLAQLYHLLGNNEMVNQYTQQAGKSRDRNLHKALNKLKRL